MVCLGNICRSPLAEGIMKKKIQEHQLNWKVDSAGTAAWHAGEKPDSRSIKVAQKNNIDILNQRGRQFQARDLDDFDLVLTMDATNYQNVRYLTTSSEQENKIHLIMNFVNPGLNQQVPDPYITDGFESVFEMLELACNKIIEKYKWDIPR
ncbi:MAG: low molecular weight phosphotyrosine protein phosphatase [Saprospiraceae bacterium]|nr:low molecular weight phosphotyrosine protein phosphatase [Saprospiraceae bacterium]